jgi:hypothetical protein
MLKLTIRVKFRSLVEIIQKKGLLNAKIQY